MEVIKAYLITRRIGPWSNRISVIIRRDTRARSCSLLLSLSCKWGHSKKEESQEEDGHPAGTLILDFSLQSWEKTNKCCLTHPVYILLWQPELTDTVSCLDEVFVGKYLFFINMFADLKYQGQ